MEKPAWHAASAHPLPQHLPGGPSARHPHRRTTAWSAFCMLFCQAPPALPVKQPLTWVVNHPSRTLTTTRAPLHVSVRSRQRLAVGSLRSPRREAAHSLRQRPSISRPSRPVWLCSGGTGTTLTSSNPANPTGSGLLRAICSWLHDGGMDGQPACQRTRPPRRSSLACHWARRSRAMHRLAAAGYGTAAARATKAAFTQVDTLFDMLLE